MTVVLAVLAVFVVLFVALCFDLYRLVTRARVDGPVLDEADALEAVRPQGSVHVIHPPDPPEAA